MSAWWPSQALGDVSIDSGKMSALTCRVFFTSKNTNTSSKKNVYLFWGPFSRSVLIEGVIIWQLNRNLIKPSAYLGQVSSSNANFGLVWKMRFWPAKRSKNDLWRRRPLRVMAFLGGGLTHNPGWGGTPTRCKIRYFMALVLTHLDMVTFSRVRSCFNRPRNNQRRYTTWLTFDKAKGSSNKKPWGVP